MFLDSLGALVLMLLVAVVSMVSFSSVTGSLRKPDISLSHVMICEP